MEVGTQCRIIGVILCATVITLTTQAPARSLITDHHFLFLGMGANDTLGCYRTAKGFPSTPYKGKLSDVIALAPTGVVNWKAKDKRTRYSLCLSTLKGFEEALAHVIATEKGQPEYKCAGAIPSLSTKLDDLYRLRLKHTIDAIWAFQAGVKLSGVRHLDNEKVMQTAQTAAATWPPPSGTRNPQWLINYVILDQFRDTVLAIRQYNVCPVPY